MYFTLVTIDGWSFVYWSMGMWCEWCEAVSAPKDNCIHELSVTDHYTKYRIQVTQGGSGVTYTLPYMVIACCVGVCYHSLALLSFLCTMERNSVRILLSFLARSSWLRLDRARLHTRTQQNSMTLTIPPSPLPPPPPLQKPSHG